MPQRRLRSRSLRRKVLGLPGGSVAIHYERRPGSQPRCRLCGGPLHGTRTSRMKIGPKSAKRPNRPYGGEVCASCLVSRIREAILQPVPTV